MQEHTKERYRRLMPNILKNLKKKSFEPYFFETIEEARHFMPTLIQKGETVGVGGSVTIRNDLNMVEFLHNEGYCVYDHWDTKDSNERLSMKRIQRSSNVFISSLNAFTYDGILVNLDGGGNRVAGLCSGPEKVIVIAGTNKLVETLDQAVDRTRHHSAPINAARLERKVPCAETGICKDCDSPERICAALLILYKKPNDIDNFTVIIVNDEMGF